MLMMLLPKFHVEYEDLVLESYDEEPDFVPAEPSFDSIESIGSKKPAKSKGRSQFIDNISGLVGNLYENCSFDEQPKEDKVEEDERPSEIRFSTVYQSTSPLVTVDIEKLRRRGVPEYVLDMILENEEELSRMKITRSCRILLTDYKIEIKMSPLDKALYFLYLRHPEGIRFKDLQDHREELLDIYKSVSGREDMDLVEDSIDTIIDPTNNSVNEKASHIKHAFTKAFSPALARYYYIDGKSGEPKSIALDRKKITWETLLP